MLFEAFRDVSANKIPLYTVCILRNVELRLDIKKDFLYKTTLNCFLDLTSYYNTIFGLKKDMKKGEEDGSHILYLVTNENMPLQEAFDLVYAELTNAFNDYMISSRKLIDVYAEDENVKKFVELMDYTLFGTILGNKLVTRYGVQNCIQIKYSDQ